MTLPRDYTLAEIDAMRTEIAKRHAEDRGAGFRVFNPAQVERILRTYMMAGVTLADLCGGVMKEPDMFEELAELEGGITAEARGVK